MSLQGAIQYKKSVLKFRTLLPQKTSKGSRYPYEKILTDGADEYLKREHPGAKCARTQFLRYQEVYDLAPYLQLTIEIYNKKGREKTIEIYS